MNPQSQSPQEQSHPKDPPCGEKPEPKPCPEPEEPSDQDPPCPEPKPCPEPPERPCPPPEPTCEEPEPPPEEPEPCEPPPPDPCSGDTSQQGEPQKPGTPAEQLESLRKSAERGSRELQKFEPLKAKLADVTARIAALEKMIESQPAATATYTEFYRATEVQRSSIECSIPTIRCQLGLTDKQKQCIAKAIASVEARVKKAQDARDAQNAEVVRLDKRQARLQRDLDWAQQWADYFKTKLQAQVTAQREDLKKLLQLADPSKDQCEAWFYLREMEALLRSARTEGQSEVCYVENINIATFLDCWSPACYTTAYEHWVVALNDAESAQKIGAIELSEAKKRAEELAAAATEAETLRREWILKEIKARDCCGPMSKCP